MMASKQQFRRPQRQLLTRKRTEWSVSDDKPMRR
jgi:hypothetical protein